MMHTGRIGHEDNLPRGLHLVSSAAVKAAGPIFTDTKGIQENSEPVALTTEGVKDVIRGHVVAAKNAIAAGFDGIELHGANGFLIAMRPPNNRGCKHNSSQIYFFNFCVR